MPGLVDHIIVVDDASSDETGRAAKDVGDARTEVIRLVENQGVGDAILTGHRRVMSLGADVAVVMAGDAQMNPNHLPALLDPIVSGEAQFTKANRFYAIGPFDGMDLRPGSGRAERTIRTRRRTARHRSETRSRCCRSRPELS